MLDHAISVASLLLLVAWELVRPRTTAKFITWRKVCNVALWFINIATVTLLLGSTWAAKAGQLIAEYTWFISWPFSEGLLSFFTAFIALDFLRYVTHRCQHLPWLWRFHKVHHADLHLDVTTSVRQHPVDFLVGSLSYFLCLFVFDIPGTVIAAYSMTEFCWSNMQHGNIRMPARVERWLKPILMTTDLHRVHHSTVYLQSNSNFAPFLTIWDRVFRTLVQLTPEELKSIRFGVIGKIGDIGKEPTRTGDPKRQPALSR